MNSIIDEIFSEINQILNSKNEIIITIEGNACSGKTTLANIISQKYESRVIHMDDFFLPIELRTNERLNTPGGNVHHERFKKEVIEFINKDISYQHFNCSIMNYDGYVNLPKKIVTIVEGSYSSHPIFSKYYDLLIFMEIDSSKQIDRIIKRDGERLLEMFVNKWLKYEELYFTTFNPKQKANIIIKDMDILDE